MGYGSLWRATKTASGPIILKQAAFCTQLYFKNTFDKIQTFFTSWTLLYKIIQIKLLFFASDLALSLKFSFAYHSACITRFNRLKNTQRNRHLHCRHIIESMLNAINRDREEGTALAAIAHEFFFFSLLTIEKTRETERMLYRRRGPTRNCVRCARAKHTPYNQQ